MPTDESSRAGLTCRELVELVTNYFENALPPEEYARVVEHLAECVGCDRYVEQLRETIGAVGTLKEKDVSPQTQERLRALFQELNQESTSNA